MRRLASTLVAAAATGALLAGSALAQPGSGDRGDARLAEVAEPCYAAPAEADRTTVTLVADETCDASDAPTREAGANAGGDAAPVARRVGPLDILP